MYRQRTNSKTYDLDRIPRECPFCSANINVPPIHTFDANCADSCQIIYQCSNSRCYRVFVALYRVDPKSEIHVLEETVPPTGIRSSAVQVASR